MRRFVEQVMGLPISLALRGRHAETPAAASAWAEVVSELRWVDRVFSTWRPDSAVCRVRRGELRISDCPPEVGEVVALGEQAEASSHGAFTVWLPDAEGVRRLEPSGVVKGWAVQRAARHLALARTDFCLSAGGDMVCSSPGEPWRIGIEDPRSPQQLAAVVPLTTGGLATSGSAHRGAHVVDGRTGTPANGLVQVTVVAPTLVEADVAATTAFALGADAEPWLRGRIATGQIAHALLIEPDGRRGVIGPPAARAG